MNRLVLVIVGLTACDAGLPPPAPTTPAPVGLAAPLVAAHGHTYAIVRVSGIHPELCTNMGGTIWVFSVEGMPADFKLHGGGHGIFGNATLPGMMPRTPDDTSWSERYYVAEIALESPPRISEHMECAEGGVIYDGTVLAVATARDLTDARAQLAAASGSGLPGAVRLGQ